jgi:metal-responsive CopG/Arc/MetJ family transcriptional regulator
MAEELKTERVTIMMTPSEVTAIDDWSFARRIRSRGEAVRRLIKMGLGDTKPTQSRSRPGRPVGRAQ